MNEEIRNTTADVHLSSMRYVRVPRALGERARRELASKGAVIREARIMEEGEDVLIPVTDEVDEALAIRLDGYLVQGLAIPRPIHRPPYDHIQELWGGRPGSEHLPRKWELLGDVLVVRIPAELEAQRFFLGSIYAQALGAKTVCQELGPIAGVYRTPQVQVIFGGGTETMHKENGIIYRLDVAKVMFSSGNMAEKKRMSALDCAGETVVDLFAGIGYFTLPLAVHAKASVVIACEINPIAHSYLVQNIALNHVEKVVRPFLGDNRDLPGEGIADRVLMGYVGDVAQFLSKAFALVKPGGVVHYHETCPIDEFPERPMARIEQASGGRKVEFLRKAEVKSYAPAISHYVIDFRAH